MHRKRARVAPTLTVGLGVTLVLLISLFTRNPCATAALPIIFDKPLLGGERDLNSNPQAQLAAVQVSPDQKRTADPGANILYDHVLINRGSTTDTISLSLDSSQGWPKALVDVNHPNGTAVLTLEVGSLLSVSFQISLTVPPTAETSWDRTTVTAISERDPFKQDTAVDSTLVSPIRVYLPKVVGISQPLPGRPTMYSTDSHIHGGFYCVEWLETSPLADTYEVSVAFNEAFTSNPWVSTVTGLSWCQGRLPLGVYYHRVRGHNEWGYGPYSNVVAVSVFPPSTPEMYPIENTDGDGNYTVSWGSSEGAFGYWLLEDTVPEFTHSTYVQTSYRQSWSATDYAPGTYYYRVIAQGYHEMSDWSNTVSVTVSATATQSLNSDPE